MVTPLAPYALYLGSPSNGERSTSPTPKSDGIRIAFKRSPIQIECTVTGIRITVDELPWAMEDAGMILDFLDRIGMRQIWSHIHAYDVNDSEHPGKEQILQKLRTFFQQDGTRFILIYSGHGTGSGSIGDGCHVGAWVFQTGENPEKDFETLTLEEVLREWDRSRTGREPRCLMIISDSCHSGEWVKILNNTKRTDICIQAACTAEETSEWSSRGSTFIREYVRATHTEQNTVKTLVNTMFFDIPYWINYIRFHSKLDREKFNFTPTSSRYAPSGFGKMLFFDSLFDMKVPRTA